jgi:hypothetical protein
MDKDKLLNTLRARRNAWNESLINTMKENIKSEASLKILNDIIAEVEDDNNPDLLSLDNIVRYINDYCEIIYRDSDGNPKCEKCPFAIQLTEHTSKCMKDEIKKNINKFYKNEDKGHEA